MLFKARRYPTLDNFLCSKKPSVIIVRISCWINKIGTGSQNIFFEKGKQISSLKQLVPAKIMNNICIPYRVIFLQSYACNCITYVLTIGVEGPADTITTLQ